MTTELASFHVKFLAGLTQMGSQNPNGVDRPNGMDGWILNRTVQGVGRIRGNSQDRCVTPGDLLLFSPRVPHLYGYEAEAGHWAHQWVYFFPRESWLEWMKWPSLSPGSPGVFRLRLEGELWEESGRLFENVIELSKSSGLLPFERAMNRLEEILLHCESVNPERQIPGFDPRLETAIRHMEATLSSWHNLDSLAQAASLSKSRFSHLFREQLGRTPMEHLEKLRVKHAMERLFISSMTLAEVAEECGFQCVFYFSRVFKKATGMPPGQFREKMRKRRLA